MSATVMRVGCVSTSAYLVPSTVIDCGTDSTVDGFTSPASMAAEMVTTFAVDPGSNTSVSGRLGLVAAADWAGWVAVAPFTLAIAKMLPV